MNDKTSKALPILGISAWIFIFVAIYLVFFNVPTEKTMGVVQRIFYFHVPSAWNAFLAFFLVFIGSIMYLRSNEMKWDALSVASAEIGFMFTSIVLVTGPLWAKPVWYIWWAWDVRLTSTLVLWLIYAGYFLLRNVIPDPVTKAKLSSIIGILAFVDIPIIYFSIRWWRTQHPSPVMAGGKGSGLDPNMKAVFFFCLFSFTLLYLFFLLMRLNTERKKMELMELQRKVLDSEAQGI